MAIMKEDRTRRREIELKYYYAHREEILQKQKERRERNKNNNDNEHNDPLEKCGRKSYEVKNNFILIDENEKFLIYSVETLSGKHLGFEVRKRTLPRNEYGKDKWSFTNDKQMREWVKSH